VCDESGAPRRLGPAPAPSCSTSSCSPTSTARTGSAPTYRNQRARLYGTGHAVGCSKALSTRTTARLGRNRDATPLALPYTKSYRGCRSKGSSNAQAGVVERRPVPRSGRRVRRRIHAPRPRQRDHRGAIALVEHGALDWDCSRDRPTCAGADLPWGTDGLFTGTNSTKRRATGTRTRAGVVSRRSPPAWLRLMPDPATISTAHNGPDSYTADEVGGAAVISVSMGRASRTRQRLDAGQGRSPKRLGNRDAIWVHSTLERRIRVGRRVSPSTPDPMTMAACLKGSIRVGWADPRLETP
jgi:hypothetical protein